MMESIEGLRIDAVGAPGRCAARDVADARHAGRRNAHDGGRNQRIFAAGDVAADILDGDQALAEHGAGVELHLERLNAVLLAFGEVDNVLMAGGEVLLEHLGQGFGLGLDLCLGNAELALPPVEVAGIAADGVVAVLRDIAEHAADGLLDLGAPLEDGNIGFLQIVARHGFGSLAKW